MLSVVSAWEISLKPELGDPSTWPAGSGRPPGNLQARILPVRLEHIAALEKLPLRHRDPFDRLLIAQAAPVRSRSSPPIRRYKNIRRCSVCGTEAASRSFSPSWPNRNHF